MRIATTGHLVAFMDDGKLTEETTKNLVTVPVGAATQEDQNRRVEHIIFVCKEPEKKDKLFDLLNDIMKDESDRIVVFMVRKQTVEDLASSLHLRGWPAVGIHGNKTEDEQKWSLDAPRSGKAAILVAADVAARNVNTASVHFVVSYDYPSNPDEYPCRLKHVTLPDVAARKYMFLKPHDYVHAREIITFFQQTNQAIAPQLSKVANMASGK
ncbi:hypothetical protein HPB52_023670 [Rhipicephalus sanguineus]|uniref:Helicase C-terminal domain-containing protein n=1 Tax=Rhipicephalus sanguineus TaxID=34632 RepID=A0A9D4PF63_RHISA|nr:hypothetical protein HPB52_023670 [Rhipicephalus sanguineus]